MKQTPGRSFGWLRRALGCVAFWLLFAALFWYAQSVVITKGISRTPDGLLLGRYTPYTNALRVESFEAMPENTVDVAILGSSTVYADINPAWLYEAEGIAAHDYSIGAMTGAIVDYLSEMVFAHQSPRVVCLDVTRQYAWFHHATTLNSTLPFTRLTKAKWNVLKDTDDLGTFVERVLPLFAQHQNWCDAQPYDFAYAFVPKRDPLLGFVGYENAAEDAEELAERFARPHESYLDFEPEVHPHLSDLSKAQLIAFQEKCLAYGAEPVLLVCPSVFANEAAQYLQEMQAFADERGMRLWNFCAERHGLSLTAQDFQNDHHLTLSGAKQFTAVLGTVLSDVFELPDRRKDAIYAPYEEAAALTRRLMDEWEEDHAL